MGFNILPDWVNQLMWALKPHGMISSPAIINTCSQLGPAFTSATHYHASELTLPSYTLSGCPVVTSTWPRMFSGIR
jgi:hypothetical protein